MGTAELFKIAFKWAHSSPDLVCVLHSLRPGEYDLYVYEISDHLDWRQQECTLSEGSCRASNPQQSALGDLRGELAAHLKKRFSQKTEQKPTLTAGSPFKECSFCHAYEVLFSCQDLFWVPILFLFFNVHFCVGMTGWWVYDEKFGLNYPFKWPFRASPQPYSNHTLASWLVTGYIGKHVRSRRFFYPFSSIPQFFTFCPNHLDRIYHFMCMTYI